jgi:hypothetical protein
MGGPVVIATARRGASPWRPENLQPAEWDARVGPTQSQTISYTSANQPAVSNSPNNIINLSRSNLNVVGLTFNGFMQINHSVVQSGYQMAYGHDTRNSQTAAFRTLFNVPLGSMYATEPNNGGIVNGPVSLVQSDVQTQLDGIWPGDGCYYGLPSIIENVRVQGSVAIMFYGYCLQPGNIPATTIGDAGTLDPVNPTVAQCLAASAVTPTAGAVYSAGQTMVTSIGGFQYMFQVSTGGTCSGTTSGWPTTPFFQLASNSTAQPYADGPNTLKVICVGPFLHADGVQIARAGAIEVRHSKITGTTNSCMLIQSSAASYDTANAFGLGAGYNSYTVSTTASSTTVTGTGQVFSSGMVGQNYFIVGLGYVVVALVQSTTQMTITQPAASTVSVAAMYVPNPTGPVRVIGNDLTGLNQYLFINTNTVDPVYGNGVYAGRYVRSNTGVWSAYTSPWLSRPEMCTVTDNLFRDKIGNNGIPTGNVPWFGGTSPSGGVATSPVLACAATTIANGATTYSAIKGDYAVYVPDEATRQAGITAQGTDLSPTFSAYEQRFQYGIFPNACDARSWIVWARNRDQRGATLFPIQRASANPGFDANGYYTGG